MMEISCRACRKIYKVPDNAVGKVAKCSKCGTLMKIMKFPQNTPGRPGAEPTANELIKVKFGVKRGEIIGFWKGKESRRIKDFEVKRPWRLLWSVKGDRMSFFTVTLQKKGKSKTLARPVNEHNIDGTKQGAVDIVNVGSLLLRIETGGGGGTVEWLIAAHDYLAE